MKTTWFKILRMVAVLLFGLTVAFALLGGIGSSCVALGVEKFDSMASLAPYQWLYQILMVTTIALAVYGFRAAVRMVRGRANAYREGVIFLVGAMLAAGIQMTASELLRGKSAPNDVRFYWTAFTLAVFLFLRLPGIWKWTGFDRPVDRAAARTTAGMALILGAIMNLTVSYWAGPTHTFGGINYADAFHQPVHLAGWGMAVAGAWLVLPAAVLKRRLTSRKAPANPHIAEV